MEKSKKVPSTPLPATVVVQAQDEIRIALPERFTFHSHREFRAGYFIGQAPAKCYVVDFTRTSFIDSAGLGMLLQLGEYAGKDPRRLRFVNCAQAVRETLLVAGLNDAATIL